MSKLRKNLQFALLTVMVLLMLPQIALDTYAANYTVKAPTMSNSGYFTAQPGVYEMGDGYAVIWATSFKGTGYIEYTYKGQKYTVYDERNGIVRTGDSIHVVKVPHEHLQGNSYTVYSREVTSHSWNTTNYGVTASAGPITLKAYDGGTRDMDLLILTDVHKQFDWAKTVAQQFKEPDLIIFSGDVVSAINEKADIVTLFNIMGTISHGSKGQTPVVYIRGNHECRGNYSTTLLEYLPTETGEYYFDFSYGPLYSVVMDTGEDKADQHIKNDGKENSPRNEYGQLANYAEYNQRQEAWLRTLRKDENATLRLGIYHIPRIHDLSRVNDTKYNLAQYIEHLGIQVGIAGHTHAVGAYYDSANQSATKLKHTVFMCGGGDDVSADKRLAVMLTMDATTQTSYFTAKYSNGSTHSTYNNYPVDFSTHITEPPAPIEEPERGLLNHFDKSKIHAAGTIKMDTQPAVFESGGDWYNVVWKTSYTGTSSTDRYTPHGSTGYVEYTYNGKTYQVFDEVGGSRRVCDDYHSVRIPKEHLNNNTYKVGSFLMLYDYVYPSSKTGRMYIAGNYVESPVYLFENRTGDTAVNLMACPDVEMGEANASIANVQNAVAKLGTSPAYVILNGNVHYVQYNDLTNLIHVAATVSGSIHPVILSRSHTECRGSVAPNILKYLPTATGEYYYTVDVGDYTLVNLDTGEDAPDDTVEKGVSKYNDRVHLNRVRQQQQAWLQSLSSGKKLVAISSRPLADHDDCFDTNFEAILKSKGAVISLAGHPDGTPSTESLYTVIPAGNGGSAYEGAYVLLSEDYAFVQKASSNGSTSREMVRLSTNTKLSAHQTEAPPLSGKVYTVSKPEHIMWMASNCSTTAANGGSFSGYTFRMANDIDLMLVPINPIGGCDTQSGDGQTNSKAFAGTFDGNGYAIKNLNVITQRNNAGLFGYLKGATVKNLTVSGGMVTAGSYSGGLAGFCSASTIEDCYVDLVVYSPNGTKVGGVAGFTTGETRITRSANHGHVIGVSTTGIIGGIVGQGAGSKTNYITNCYNRGSVTLHSNDTRGLAGGIIGYTASGVYEISNCYNAATVVSGRAGCIISYLESNHKTKISNVFYAFRPTGSTVSGCSTGSGWEQKDMKTQNFAVKLGASVYTHVAKLNAGYPVHWNSIHYGNTTHDAYIAQVISNPTCTIPGAKLYTCSCGDTYTEEIPALGHTQVIDQALVATCTESGLTEGRHCTVCNTVLVAQNIIPALGHTEVIDAAVDATCTATGLAEGKHCDLCGEVLVTQGIIPALGHTEVVDKALDATCTQSGLTEGKHCSACGEVFVAQTMIEALGHTQVTDAAVDATCTTAGLTAGKHCDLCGEVLVSQIVIDALGHTQETIPGIAADCENVGITDGVKCSACDEILTQQEIVPALGHNYENGICNRCGKTDPTPVVSDKVEGLHATDVTPFTFTVEWRPLQGAKKYWVYINGCLYRSNTEPNLTVLKRTPENTYNVSVIALMEDGKILPLDEANVISITAKPYVWTYAKTDTTVTLTWDVVGCTKTWIYYGTSADNLTLYTSTTESSYTMTNLQPGTVYYFQMSHLINGTVSTTVKHMTVITRPSATKVEGLTAVDVTADTITVSWDALAGATKYWIYVDGKSYSGTTGTTLTIKRLNPDTDYTIAVNALHNGKILPIADAKTITVHTA